MPEKTSATLFLSQSYRQGTMLRILLAVFGICLGLAACGSSDGLNGSISQVMSINFDRTSITLNQNTMSISYLQGGDVVCGLRFDITADVYRDGVTISGQKFLNQFALTRSTADRTQFPNIQDANLTFTHYSNENKGYLSGSFSIDFVGGYTMNGNFGDTIVFTY